MLSASSPSQHPDLELQEDSAMRVQAASPVTKPPLPPPLNDVNQILQFQPHKAPVTPIVLPVLNQVGSLPYLSQYALDTNVAQTFHGIKKYFTPCQLFMPTPHYFTNYRF